MPIRLNDIESVLRVKFGDTIDGFQKTADSADKFGSRLTKADRALGQFGRGIGQAAQASDSAFSLIESASGKSLAGVQAATSGVLGAASQTAIVAGTIGQTSGAVVKLTANIGGLSTALSIGLVGALVLVAGFAAKTAVDLNKISAATQKINDQTAKAPLLAQYRAELAALTGTVAQLEKGTLDAKDAEAEFQRFGISGIDQATQRVNALHGVIEALTAEKKAEDEANKAKKERVAFEKELADRAAARIHATEIEIAEEERLAKFQKENAKTLAVTPAEQAAALPPIQGTGPTDLQATLDAMNAGSAQAKALKGEVGKGVADQFAVPESTTKGISAAADALAKAEEKARGLSDGIQHVQTAAESLGAKFGPLGEQIGGAIDNATQGAAHLGVALGEDLFFNAGKGQAGVDKLFQQLLADLARSIVQAIILQKIIGSFGGGGVLGFLGGLFQDPTADLFARFEGSRFADLFFQGVQKKIGGIQDRVTANLEENRQIVDTQHAPTNVQVHEATPETWVELTDRKIEPRIRRRGFQRTGTALPQGRI